VGSQVRIRIAPLMTWQRGCVFTLTLLFTSLLQGTIMCGRFALKAPPRSVQEHFHLPETVDLSPRYNVAPSQEIAVVRQLPGNSLRQLDMLRWGLIPPWAKDMKIGYRMINARAETLAQKPSFRSAFKRRRCLVAADGFYEWKHAGKTKEPFLVQLQEESVFGFAGLWEAWSSPDGNLVESCTIITTSANELIREIHDRMPVILHPDHYNPWLQDSSAEKTLQQLLIPFPAAEMKMSRVSPEINNPKNDTPACMRPI